MRKANCSEYLRHFFFSHRRSAQEPRAHRKGGGPGGGPVAALLRLRSWGAARVAEISHIPTWETSRANPNAEEIAALGPARAASRPKSRRSWPHQVSGRMSGAPPPQRMGARRSCGWPGAGPRTGLSTFTFRRISPTRFACLELPEQNEGRESARGEVLYVFPRLGVPVPTMAFRRRCL